MILWLLLTILDFSIACALLLMHFGVFDSWRILLSSGVYLIGKGFLFQGSFLSILDVICGVYVFLMLLGIRSVLDLAVVGYLFYKVVVYIVLR